MLNTLYKDRLSQTEQRAYEELCQGIRLHRQDVQIPFQTDLTTVLSAVNYDHPEFFYVNWLEGFQIVQYIGRMSIHLSLIYSEKEIAEINRKIATLAKDIPGISNYGKALGIHDWFVRNIDYDHNGLEETIRSPGIFSAAGPLLRKKAVCEGISKLACLLLRQKGVDSAVIAGFSADGTPHAWNAFGSDDRAILYTDITYDIGSSLDQRFPCHRYFNLTRAEISKDHTFSLI